MRWIVTVDTTKATAAGAGAELLYDDREESPGVKFTDAELLGMPRILTVSPRSLKAGGVEITDRHTGERRVAPLQEAEALLGTPEALGES